MKPISALLNPSTIIGAVLCGIIATIIFTVATRIFYKAKKKKGSIKGSIEKVKVSGNVAGDFNYKSKVIDNSVKIDLNVDNDLLKVNNAILFELQEKLTKLIIDQNRDSTDINLNELITLLASRTKSRIDKFKEIDLMNWLYSKDVENKKKKILGDLQQLNDKTETRISEIIQEVGNEASVIRLLFDEYVQMEEKHLRTLMNSFSKDTIDTFLQTGHDYQNYMKSIISDLIEKYNRNLDTMNKFQKHNIVEKIPNEYKQVREVVYYSDVHDRNSKVQEVIKEIIKSGNVGSINVFKNKVEQLGGIGIPPTIQGFVFNGDVAGESGIVEILEGIYESIDKETLNQFHPHFMKNYIIFLCRITEVYKEQLYELQLRSNLGYYFFEYK